MKTITTIRVHLGERSYDIHLGRGWIGELGSILGPMMADYRAVVITNPRIGEQWASPVATSLQAAGLSHELFTIDEGEQAKTLETVSLILDFLIERRYERRTVLIALGGGVVGDIVGFAAATFLRGVALVQLPTSLLAMVDSSIGGKTGVNHRLGKNLIGAFKQPRLVGIDLDFLATLPEAEFTAGLAEVVKYGMIADAEFFRYLQAHTGPIMDKQEGPLSHIIARSCRIKADVVAQDEREEQGLRAILNFGHTFAHGVENLSRYGAVRHGEAVAMGMMAACRLASRVGGLPAQAASELEDLLKVLGLPVRLPRFEPRQYLDVMRVDKKVRSGRIRFVLPEKIGKVTLRDDIEEAEVIEALEASF